MKISKIRTALHLDNVISKSKVNKLVTIAQDTIPGTSFEQLIASKKDIAIFARKNGLSEVKIFDPRTRMGEHDSPVIENRFSSMVGIDVLKGSNQHAEGHLEFPFASPKDFIPQFFDKLIFLIK